jgi:hypothetical protein
MVRIANLIALTTGVVVIENAELTCREIRDPSAVTMLVAPCKPLDIDSLLDRSGVRLDALESPLMNPVIVFSVGDVVADRLNVTWVDFPPRTLNARLIPRLRGPLVPRIRERPGLVVTDNGIDRRN